MDGAITPKPLKSDNHTTVVLSVTTPQVFIITVTKRTKYFIHFELYGKSVKRKVSTWFKGIESVSVVSGCTVSADKKSEDYEHYPYGM